MCILSPRYLTIQGSCIPHELCMAQSYNHELKLLSVLYWFDLLRVGIPLLTFVFVFIPTQTQVKELLWSQTHFLIRLTITVVTNTLSDTSYYYCGHKHTFWFVVLLLWSQTHFLIRRTITVVTNTLFDSSYHYSGHKHTFWYVVPLQWSQTHFLIRRTITVVTKTLFDSSYNYSGHKHTFW
jgi:hypothetical protein